MEFEGRRRWCCVYICGQVIPRTHYPLAGCKPAQIKSTLPAAFEFGRRAHFALRRKVLEPLMARLPPI